MPATTGLMYYGARYYDRMVGMFVSPDSLVPDPTNVWDYNRYGYARLNPLKYNDPTGHCASVLAAAAAGGFSAPVAIVVDSGCLAAAGGAAVATGGAVGVLAVGVYGYLHSTDELPAIPPSQPEVLTDSGFTVTIPVPGSTTVTSGVPLIPGESTSVPGITAQSGIQAPQIVEPALAEHKGSNVVKIVPLGRGSTGRTAARDLTEQLAMEQALSNPSAGKRVPLAKGMTDPRWPGNEGWIKMSQNINGVEVHYVYNTQSDEVDDLKFVEQK